jgi:hypothetical protein
LRDATPSISPAAVSKLRRFSDMTTSPRKTNFSSVGIMLLCEVFMKPLEAAGVFSGWLYLDDHVYFPTTALSLLTALSTADNVEFSSFRRTSSSGRPLIVSVYVWPSGRD